MFVKKIDCEVKDCDVWITRPKLWITRPKLWISLWISLGIIQSYAKVCIELSTAFWSYPQISTELSTELSTGCPE